MARLLLQYPSYGPYHVARLRATQETFQQKGVEVLALETSPRDHYNWQTIDSLRPKEVVTLFPETPYEALDAPTVHKETWNTLNQLNPDAIAITSYSFPDARACLLWCRRHRRRAILMSPSKADDAPRQALREAIKKRIVQQFDAALVGGQLHRAYYASLGMPEERIFPGYNVVDNAYFAHMNPTEHPTLYREIRRYQPFFLTVTRFLRRKNIPRLLEAYAHYSNNTDHPWNLVIVGDGPLRPSIQKRIQELELSRVFLVGKRPLREVALFYHAASALIHPPEADQWGLVVNEAMAAGLPVLVSTGAGCHPELVHEGYNGFTFPPHDVHRLAQLMTALTRMPSEERARMGAASQRIIGQWGPHRFAEGLWNAYRTAATSAARGLDPFVGALLWGLNHIVPRPTAFHTVEH